MIGEIRIAVVVRWVVIVVVGVGGTTVVEVVASIHCFFMCFNDLYGGGWLWTGVGGLLQRLCMEVVGCAFASTICMEGLAVHLLQRFVWRWVAVHLPKRLYGGGWLCICFNDS